MILLDPDTLIRWTPSRHLKDVPKPVFLLRPPNGRRFLRIMQHATSVEDGAVRFRGEDAIRACQESLAGWEGITDREGNPVAFPGSEAAVEWLDFRTMREMATEIFRLSAVPDELEGNSEPGLSSHSGSSGIDVSGVQTAGVPE